MYGSSAYADGVAAERPFTWILCARFTPHFQIRVHWPRFVGWSRTSVLMLFIAIVGWNTPTSPCTTGIEDLLMS